MTIRRSQLIDGRYNRSYTPPMKTAISIPDEVFAEAEQVARNLGLSRSQLYTRAVTAFLKSQNSDEVTRKLDELYSELPSTLDSGLVGLQSASLDPW
jgi:predicted transcriptional regulator